ncbi:lipase secretion chaperone [Acinetobacter sp. ANC 4648]|uniref:lipase secretion chaperone n=1 Tax=Acinetobacter sp. ANC 4648 TaxID=1977875 RepID=UPI000A33EB68|nr:lipase secretion chaperone [Acinetobacter sp. ANC 4648]OTG82292.1 hypothetical protein B9T27_08595 [Acinetobacter sp. ANC 4648]
MKHFWLIAVVLSLLVIIVGAGIWFGLSPSYAASKLDQTQTSSPSLTKPDQPIDLQNKLTDANNNESKMHQQQQLESIQKIIQAFQNNPGNVTQLFAQLQQNCFDATCQALLKQALAEYPDQQFAQTLKQLFERFPMYEKAMQAKIMSTQMTPQQRYQEIWNLREQTLGQKEAQLGFGEEKKFASYQFAYGELLSRAPQMTQQQRLQELAELQQQYKDLSKNIDGQSGSYDKALKLALIGVTDPAQQQKITQQLRSSYFSPKEVAQFAAREQQVDRQQQQVESYQSELATLNQEMNQRKQSLSENIWQQQYQLRLEQLRQKHFN